MAAPLLTKRHCPDCDEDYISEEAYCLICGAKILIIPVTQSAIAVVSDDDRGQSEDNITAYLDLFGVDFQDLLQRFNASTNNRNISEDYARTLGKIDVDERHTILFNFVIQIGPLKINAVPANFSPLSVEDIIEAPLIISEPIWGDALENATQLRGRIVLMERGKVSFAQKCKQATACGAVGIIIAQTNATWPFVMADSAAELGGAIACIPVCMVSQSDGELLLKWVRSKESASSGSTKIVFKGEELNNECCVCQDTMEMNDNVLRLSCCHCFHSECIMRWLHKHNNCPMCRHEMPSSVSTTSQSSARPDDTHSAPSHRQSYFS